MLNQTSSKPQCFKSKCDTCTYKDKCVNRESSVTNGYTYVPNVGSGTTITWGNNVR